MYCRVGLLFRGREEAEGRVIGIVRNLEATLLLRAGVLVSGKTLGLVFDARNLFPVKEDFVAVQNKTANANIVTITIPLLPQIGYT